MAGPTAVRGLRDVQRGLKDVEKEVRLGFRKELRAVAEPVRADAEIRAGVGIPNVGVAWARMRVGVTQTSVYVAPRERGLKASVRKRPNLASLLMGRAMEPALEAHGAQAEQAVERALERICDRFNRSI